MAADPGLPLLPGRRRGGGAPVRWLSRHPLAAAALYMLLGGGLGEDIRHW